ncbi:MAG: hypothetical protein ACQXXC_00985 [Methanolinea tarda]
MKKRILAQLQTPDDALDAWRRYRTIPRDEYGKISGICRTGYAMRCSLPSGRQSTLRGKSRS